MGYIDVKDEWQLLDRVCRKGDGKEKNDIFNSFFPFSFKNKNKQKNESRVSVIFMTSKETQPTT